MNNIPTAEEILIKNTILIKPIKESENFPLNLSRDTYIQSAHNIKNSMIEFAKLHVEACKQSILAKARTFSKEEYDERKGEYFYIQHIDSESILNAYPLDAIE